jgi:tRNA threonylcarbamoyladenosine biosynthesis protein TsaB
MPDGPDARVPDARVPDARELGARELGARVPGARVPGAIRASGPGPLTLVIDTSTRASIVAVGRPRGRLVTSRREAGSRHAAFLLDQVDELASDGRVEFSLVELLAVGLGPGSFTGLRVGLATAKTLAHVLDLPIVGLPSTDALRLAAVEGAAAPPDVAVVLPAGAHDHYLALAGRDPLLVPPDGLVEALAGGPALCVDCPPSLLGETAARWGTAAVDGLPAALLALAGRYHAEGRLDDAAALVPAYVALPRGVSRAAEDLGWSPDLR